MRKSIATLTAAAVLLTGLASSALAEGGSNSQPTTQGEPGLPGVVVYSDVNHNAAATTAPASNIGSSGDDGIRRGRRNGKIQDGFLFQNLKEARH